MLGISLSSASYLLLAALALILLAAVADFLRKRSPDDGKTTPGPKPWPLIGSLHLLGGYEVPYQAFDNLAKKYGPVFGIKLGQVPCLVVSNLEHVREVLFTKGNQFDGRPNFRRYHQLFDGNKQNSLAFCDWSEMQKKRRDMLKLHTFPKAFTTRFYHLDSLLSEQLEDMCRGLSPQETAIKPHLLQTCANVFISYFCSVKFSKDDADFTKMVRNFDEIFYEVNQGYAADFMPWLLPLHKRNLARMEKWSHEIREFMINRVISKRLESYTPGEEQMDYVDALIDHVKQEGATMDLDTALFALEDIVGGHSAVANLLVKIIGFIANNPQVQKRMQEEVDAATQGRSLSLADRHDMPYTEAVILEGIRYISSPIVPHVANKDTTLGGCEVKEGTLIFLNNYTLNMSPDLWTDPEAFNPERFLNSEGRISKPEHFLPFGGGRRSCMGYKLTQYVSFATLATLMQRFHIFPAKGESLKVPLGNLALPYDTLNFRFQPR